MMRLLRPRYSSTCSGQARSLSAYGDCFAQGGILAVMTQMVRDAEAFSRWRYKDDITHICFFCPETFAWIGERFGLEVELISDSVVFLTAPPEHSSARAAIGPPSNTECSASKW